MQERFDQNKSNCVKINRSPADAQVVQDTSVLDDSEENRSYQLNAVKELVSEVRSGSPQILTSDAANQLLVYGLNGSWVQFQLYFLGCCGKTSPSSSSSAACLHESRGMRQIFGKEPLWAKTLSDLCRLTSQQKTHQCVWLFTIRKHLENHFVWFCLVRHKYDRILNRPGSTPPT